MRNILIQAAKIGISAGLLYLALRKVDLANLWSRITADSVGWLVLAALIMLLQVLLGGLRWREITERCDAPLPAREAIRFTMIGMFFNQTLPSTIGGDAVKIWLVGRGPAGWKAATYSVFIDRAIGLIALAVLIALTLPWSYQLIGNPAGRMAITLIDAAALAGGFGFLLLGVLPFPWLKTWWPTRHFHACSVIANRALFDGRSTLFIAVLSFAVHLLTVVAAWCVVQSIAAPIGFAATLSLIPPIMLITMLPISIAGWGVRETAMMVAFGYAGLPENDGVNVSLLFGAVTFFVGALGGIVWILSAEKSARAKEALSADLV